MKRDKKNILLLKVAEVKHATDIDEQKLTGRNDVPADRMCPLGYLAGSDSGMFLRVI